MTERSLKSAQDTPRPSSRAYKNPSVTKAFLAADVHHVTKAYTVVFDLQLREKVAERLIQVSYQCFPTGKRSKLHQIIPRLNHAVNPCILLRPFAEPSIKLDIARLLPQDLCRQCPRVSCRQDTNADVRVCSWAAWYGTLLRCFHVWPLGVLDRIYYISRY